MSNNNPNDKLHGVKLEAVLSRLVKHYGWQELANQIDINCFKINPTIKSSLKFLRKTPWARSKVEQLYLVSFSQNNPWQLNRIQD